MTGALSLLAGVLLGLLSADVPDACWQIATALLVLARVVSWARHRGPGDRHAAAAALLLAGWLLASVQAAHWLRHALPEQGRLLAEGRIVSVPERQGDSLRFDFRSDRLEGVAAPQRPRLLRVQWRNPGSAPRVGERWRLLVRLAPLEETRNFAGFDAARMAFRAGVHGGGRVLPSNLNGLIALAPAGLDTVRARIAHRVHDAIADPDAAALVSALAVGITAGMSRDQWRVFNATGTTHLVAISGLHVTMFAWLAFRGGRVAWRLTRGRGPSREPFALWLGLAAAGGYALLAGLSVPTLRTWLMLALFVGARLMARRIDPARLWSLALVAVLLTDPRAPLAAGFWLSFVAVGVLLAFASEPTSSGASRWHSAVRAQLVVMLALVPASLAIFGGVSVVGLAVNLVAIPLISLVLVPLVLAGALAAWLLPPLDAPCFALAAQLYDVFWPALAWCADQELLPALWRASPSVGWYAFAVPTTLICLCPVHGSLRLCALGALLTLGFVGPGGPHPGTAHVSVFDAGRGAAVLVRTRQHALLFDTGDAWNSRGSRLSAIVLPAMDATQTRRIDRLLLPALNGDRAHAAALLAVERGLGETWAAGRWPGNDTAVPCRDSTWWWDEVRFEVFTSRGFCLLRLISGDAALLMAGDLDVAGERDLLANAGAGALASDVILVGRQAGEGASSSQWIEGIGPELAIATGGTEGARSRQRVLARWRGQGARVLDTRREGAVQLSLSAQGAEVMAVARRSRFPFHWRRVRDDPG